MKEMKLHAYLITFINSEDLERISNVMVCAYDKDEAVTILKNAPIGKYVVAVVKVQTLRKNKNNARWFTQETYERELKLTGLKGK